MKPVLILTVFAVTTAFAYSNGRRHNQDEYDGTRPSPIDDEDPSEGDIDIDGSKTTKFFLHSKNHVNTGLEVTTGNELKNLKDAYNPKKQNVFVVHGWKNDKNSMVNKVLVPAILKKNDVNVFVVDWSHKSKHLYTVSRLSVDGIGKDVSIFVKSIMSTFGLNGNDFVFIGHSLGAHVVGLAGQNFKDGNKIGYIVGLDPAHPLFILSKPDTYLDHTDAQHVTIIHTNGGTLGIQSAIGHVDFYPNGGDKQPGCQFMEDFTGSCSHARSYEYFAESLVTGGFTSFECNGYQQFDSGACNKNYHTNIGGLKFPTNHVADFYLNTRSQAPFSFS